MKTKQCQVGKGGNTPAWKPLLYIIYILIRLKFLFLPSHVISCVLVPNVLLVAYGTNEENILNTSAKLKIEVKTSPASLGLNHYCPGSQYILLTGTSLTNAIEFIW